MKTKVIYLSMVIAIIAMMAPGQVNGQSVGSPAPDFTLSTDAGTTFKLSSQQGKVVFIFLFGYGCPHCKENGNNTETGIYNVYKGNSDFVAVGVDTWNGNAAGVAAFKTYTGITYPSCYNGSSLESLYGTTYDRIIVVDRDGIIQYKSSANSTSSVVETASSVISSLLSVTSVGNITQDDVLFLSVYPNPTTDQIYIKPPVKSEGVATISILNTSGQLVAIKKVQNISTDEVASMSVSLLPAGLYLLRYRADNKEKTVKLVVERD